MRYHYCSASHVTSRKQPLLREQFRFLRHVVGVVPRLLHLPRAVACSTHEVHVPCSGSLALTTHCLQSQPPHLRSWFAHSRNSPSSCHYSGIPSSQHVPANTDKHPSDELGTESAWFSQEVDLARHSPSDPLGKGKSWPKRKASQESRMDVMRR